MTEGKALQWASLIVPSLLAITMAVMAFANRTNAINTTNSVKVSQLEVEIKEIKLDIEKLDKEKVDKEIIDILFEKIDKIDTKIDDIKDKKKGGQ